MSFISDIFVTFVVFFMCYNAITATDIIKDEPDKGSHSERGALWFGPRLGKRSLQLVDEDNSQAILKLLEAADAVKYYYNQMPYEMQSDVPQTKVAKKIIFTPKLGRSPDVQGLYENVNFTPRLGRKMAEKIPVTTVADDTYGQDSVQKIHVLTNHFMPRLGRNFHFSPRLGRDLIYDLYSEPQIRVARSVNMTKSSQF